jgi:hypothetical protein
MPSPFPGMDPYLESPRLPLLPEDPPVLLDLQAAFNQAYDAGPYRKTIWYGKDPIDRPLQPEQATWAASRVNSLTAR